GRLPRMAAPVMLMFLRNRRRLSGIWCSLRQSFKKLRRAHEGDEQFLDLEAGVAERTERCLDRLTISRTFETPERVTKQLLDDAFLASPAVREQSPNLLRFGERAVREARNLAG